MTRTPLIFLTVAYTAGILLGHGFLYFPATATLLAGAALLVIVLSALLGKIRKRRAVLIALSALVGMTACVVSAAWSPPNHYSRRFPPDNHHHTITGTVVSALDRFPDRTGFVLEALQIDGKEVSGRIRVSLRDPFPTLGYGDQVRLKGKLHEPRGFLNPGGFDYPEYLAQNGIYATMSVRNGKAVAVLRRGTGLFRTVQDLRERIRQALLTGTSGSGSAILQAMVIGEEGGLTEDLRERYMAAGVTHIISISGSHLGMVALLCFGLFKGLLLLLPERLYHRLTLHTDPAKIAAVLTLPPVVFYTLLAGGETATIRSLIMISSGLLAFVLDREHGLMHALALAALVILAASPQALFDISFQLSYISVLVIGSVASLWNAVAKKPEGLVEKVGRGALLLILISVAAGLATGPLVARYFNQVSLAAIVSNLVVVPFAGLIVVPLGLLSGVLSLFIGRLPLPALNQAAADVFNGIVDFFARFPLAEFHPPAPSIVWLVCYAAFVLSLFHLLRVRILSRKNPFEISSRISLLPRIVLAASAMFLVFGAVLAAVPARHTVVSFPDVGQGDSALIELASGKAVLVDGGGTRDNRFDIGKRVVAPFLWNRGIRHIDAVVLSHPHPDHMNGLLFLLRKFSVSEVWSSGLDTGLPGYEAFEKIITEKDIPHRIAAGGDTVMLGGAEFRFLHPSPGYEAVERRAYAAENDRSLVLRVASDGRVFLFPGDIGTDAEKSLAAGGPALKCDILKVPHHGSRSSSSEPFVALTKPEIAVLTVGRNNPYRHPAEEVVERYRSRGARICRTDRDGAVLISMKRDGLRVLRWNELVLRRIRLDDPGSWSGLEQSNWKRLWVRTWGI